MRQLLLVWLAVVAVSHSLDDDQVFQSSKESATQLNQNALNDRALGVNVGDGGAQSEPAKTATTGLAPRPNNVETSLPNLFESPRGAKRKRTPPDGKWRFERKCDPGFALAPLDEFGQEGWVRGEKHADLWVVRWKCKCADATGDCKRKGDEKAKTSVLQYYDFVAKAPPTKKDGSPSDKPQSDENTPATVTKLYTLWTAHQAERTADLETVSLGESTDEETDWVNFKWWEKKCGDGTDFPKLAPKPRCNSATGEGCHDFSVKNGKN